MRILILLPFLLLLGGCGNAPLSDAEKKVVGKYAGSFFFFGPAEITLNEDRTATIVNKQSGEKITEKWKLDGERVTIGESNWSLDSALNLWNDDGLPVTLYRQMPFGMNKDTKEFVLGLWAQPNDETDLMQEITLMGKSGTWTYSGVVGPNKNEMVHSIEGKTIEKYVDRRYRVSKTIREDSAVTYGVTTYDVKKGKYKFLEYTETSKGDYTAEFSGKLTGAQSIEWKTVVSPLQGDEMSSIVLYKTDKRIETVSEILTEGEIRVASKTIRIWSEGLP